MITQKDTQKELREILKDLFCFDCPQQWCRIPKEDTCKSIEKSEYQILNLFRKMAKECVYEVNLKENLIGFHDTQAQFLEGMDRCAKQTHKNIEEKFR